MWCLRSRDSDAAVAIPEWSADASSMPAAAGFTFGPCVERFVGTDPYSGKEEEQAERAEEEERKRRSLEEERSGGGGRVKARRQVKPELEKC